MSTAYQLMEAQEAEVTMEQAFAMALTDDNLHDVTLLCSDGVRVPAIRNLLALRSKVFRKMLYGNFQEATQDVVKVDYPGAVVQAIVEYIHTNKSEILAQPSGNMDVDEELLDEARHEARWVTRQEVFQTLLTLTAAAAYYNLPKLCHDVHKCLTSFVEGFPMLSFAVVEAWVQQGAAISEELKQQALISIRHLLSLHSNGDGLKVLSSSGLELVLSDDKVLLGERYRFRLIEMWSSITGADQHDVAKSMIEKHVKLDLIDPDYLSSEVTSSGLVTMKQLAEAYQQQAKRAKHLFSIAFDNNIVSNPIWKSTKSSLFQVQEDDWKGDSLQCPILTVGRSYRWIVQTSGTNTPLVWLGVIPSTAIERPLGYCGNQEQSWGIYGCEGQEWSSKKNGKLLGDDAKFGAESSVVMTLDLSPEEENNGSLSISVNGKPDVLVLRDMCSKLSGIDGVIPTVSCHSASATILSMTPV